ncbi:MAG: hypothetical protein AcusKO_09660 [Acuticoccus sp.]
MRFAALTAAALSAALLAAPADAQGPSPAPASDYVKRAGNFLKNCDARTDAAGQRPEANYVCLAFMAGLVEGYSYAAIANGNPRPYCLPRPASLAELSDMMATVIERGVPETMPTAAVFHFIMQKNFPCAPQDSGAATPPAGAPGEVRTAQNNGALLEVTPPQALGQGEPKLSIITPEQEADAPKLPIVEPARTQTGTIPPADAPATTADPAVSGGIATPAAPTPPGTPDAATAPQAGTPPPATTTDGGTAEAPAPVIRPGTALGPTSASGPQSATGPQSASGFAGAEGPGSAVGPQSAEGAATAEGSVLVPQDGPLRNDAKPSIVVNPLQEPRGSLAAPVAPAQPATPQGARPIGAN